MIESQCKNGGKKSSRVSKSCQVGIMKDLQQEYFTSYKKQTHVLRVRTKKNVLIPQSKHMLWVFTILRSNFFFYLSLCYLPLFLPFTAVVLFIHIGILFCKQCGPRSDCSVRMLYIQLVFHTKSFDANDTQGLLHR